MRLNSTTDIPLSAGGKIQIESLNLSFNSKTINCIYTSPATRAMETANMLSRNNKIQIRQDARLREVEFGQFEGQDAISLEERNESEIFSRWRAGEEFDVSAYGLESLIHASDRAISFLHDFESDEGTYLVVSHGYLLRILIVVSVFNKDPGCFRKIWLANGSYSQLESSQAGYVLRSLNVAVEEA